VAEAKQAVCPQEFGYQTTPTPSEAVSRYGLPAEVVRSAVRRLGFLGLIVALMAPSAYLFELLTQRERVVPGGGMFPFPLLEALFLLVSGATICLLAWRRKAPPEFVLDLGLVFQVAVALAISISENATAWPEGPIRGISWNCLWIPMYVVAIPGTFGKSVVAVLASASMAPFGLTLAHAVNGIPLPPWQQTAILLFPPFVAAGWAIPAARYLYRLGAQVSRARAMGSYELLELIGRGGMGEVWRARHRILARDSAIKLIRPEALSVHGAGDSQILLHRFEREARATAGLHSPHTVALYDYGVSDDGRFYYVMELLDGIDLETLVQRFGPLPAGRVIHLLTQTAKSLAEAHASGLVHRDIKPRNVFACRMGTDNDFVKVLDFGLVKYTGSGEYQTSLTLEGVTTGTPAYMAPEVATGQTTIDGRADIYSLGCVGYWLLTGHLVFEESTPVAMVLAHVQKAPTPPSQRTEIEIPAAMEGLILQCLEKEPSRRPQTAGELSRLLMACGPVEAWTEDHADRWWHAHRPRVSGAGSEAAAGSGAAAQ
jgi:eukaryotic-like serine/threonine-protein kinase